MARKRSEHRNPRLPFRALPTSWTSLASVLAGAVLIGMGWLSRGQGTVTVAVWVVLGAFMVVQPLLWFITGDNNTLRMGLRRIDLGQLSKVTVFHTKNLGITTPTAVLISPHQVVHVSGLFLTKKDFARLVGWFGVPVEKIDGVWNTKSLLSVRTDLVER